MRPELPFATGAEVAGVVVEADGERASRPAIASRR